SHHPLLPPSFPTRRSSDLGQPINFPCPSAVSTGTNCLAYVITGKNPRTDLHLSSDGHPIMLNAAAFAQPCVVGSTGCNPASPLRSEEHTSELQSRENLVCR